MLRRVAWQGRGEDGYDFEQWTMEVYDDVSFWIDDQKEDGEIEDFDGWVFSMPFKKAMEAIFLGKSTNTRCGEVRFSKDWTDIGDTRTKTPQGFLDDCKKALIDAASDRVERFRTLRGEMQAIINRSKDNCHE